MSTFFNGKMLQSLTGGTIVFTEPPASGSGAGSTIAGYVSPNLQNLDLLHKGDVDLVPNQAGQIASLIVTDEWIELVFDYFPQGTDDTNARASATLPKIGSKAAITGLPIVQIGSFADGLNTNGSSTQPWIYLGDGGVGGHAKEKWDGKITLRRYVNITSAAAYVVV